MQLYALDTQTGLFDCSAGCDFSQMTLTFTDSGGNDTYGFIVRQQVIAITVPEPATLALLGLGLAGLGFARRKQ